MFESLAHLVTETVGRLDGWKNLVTGMGTSRDRTMASRFEANCRITEQEASELYRFSAVARRIIDLLPNEATRLDWCWRGSVNDVFTARMRELDVRCKVREGLRWGRVFGGAGIFLGTEGGGSAETPIREESVRELSFLAVYDKRQMQPIRRYTTPGHPKLGRPELYLVTEVWGGTMTVHESRFIMCGGAETPEREWHQNGGWDDSVFDSIYDDLKSFSEAWKNAGFMLGDATQAVYKMRGLISRLGAKGEADVRTRMQFTDMMRGVFRGIVLDENESFEKVATSFTGLPDMLDREAQKLAAATGIPLTLLMGMSPAGLNATGESDIRIWYDSVKAYQEEQVRPRVERIARLVAGAKAPQLTFSPLWSETGKERAEREKLIVDADAVRIASQVLSPEEVALARHSREDWDAPIELESEQIAERERMMDEPEEEAPNAETPPTDESATADPADEG